LFESTKGKDTLSLLYLGEVDGIGGEPHFLVHDSNGQRLVDKRLKAKATILPGHKEALAVLLDWVERYEYIASVLPDYAGSKADGRVIIAHIGNGASMCALLSPFQPRSDDFWLTAAGGE
jgi:hypothetical protein